MSGARMRRAGGLSAFCAALALGGCAPRPEPSPGLLGADPARGAALARSVGCGACHEIPGVLGAHGRAAPSLENFGRRTTVAGLLPNTPESLVRWLRNPQAILPGNAMPDTGLSVLEARDVAAYLYTLR